MPEREARTVLGGMEPAEHENGLRPGTPREADAIANPGCKQKGR